ncbi:YdcF family protein [Conchiformibius kuhniae]|uniref:YdcF family protein n=1 Tax=Conchiformibius kuhniae TaxID=211502 RepID=UPI00041DD70C|nr:YdcF family protein [Conchiformibius kuhniae]
MRKIFDLFLLVSLLAVVFVVLLACVSMWQVRRDARLIAHPSAKADAAVVLGAAAWGNKPSPVFRERIAHGIDLYRNGTVGKLIFTGGTPKKGYPTEAEVGKRFAIKHGVSERDILTEHASTSTYENLKNTRALMRRHKIGSVIIISDPAHMARARAMAQDLGISAEYSAPPPSRYADSSKANDFFVRETVYLCLFRLWQLAKWLRGGQD